MNILINKLFIDWLINNQLYDKFIFNLKYYKWTENGKYNLYKHNLYDLDYDNVYFMSFNWDKSEEGFKYWSFIYYRWTNYYKNNIKYICKLDKL